MQPPSSCNALTPQPAWVCEFGAWSFTACTSSFPIILKLSLFYYHDEPVLSSHWATGDSSWPKKQSWCTWTDLHLKKKNPQKQRQTEQAGSDLWNLPPEDLHAREKPPQTKKQTSWWTSSLRLTTNDLELQQKVFHGDTLAQQVSLRNTMLFKKGKQEGRCVSTLMTLTISVLSTTANPAHPPSSHDTTLMFPGTTDYSGTGLKGHVP